MRTSEQIDRLIAQWQPERPDLDLGAMASVARLLAVAQRLQTSLAELAGSYGVQTAEADLLFTLRRAGAPYRLTPTALSESLLVSSGTLTSRLDRLEAKGLIARTPHPRDRRSMEVQLTDKARELVDAAVTVHVDNERRLLAGLSERERAQLDRLIGKLLDGLDRLDGEGEAGS